MKWLATAAIWPFLLLASGCGAPRAADRGFDAPGRPRTPAPSTSVFGSRTPIDTLAGSATALHVISASGSYCLAGHITGVTAKSAIEITADDVTVDLMGFSIVGVVGARNGVVVSTGRRNVVLANGTVRDWPKAGVDARHASNSRFEGLQSHKNGLEGLAVGIGSVVTRCEASDNGGDGIATDVGCVVTDCTAWRNGLGGFGGDGIDAGDGSTVTGCAARDNADAGIFADLGCTVARCSARDNSGDGIRAGAGTTITDCTASLNEADGIHADSGATVEGCTVALNGGDGIEVSSFCLVARNNASVNGLSPSVAAGIRVTGLDNRIEGNNAALNGYGIEVTDVGNLIISNRATHNGAGPDDDFIVSDGNSLGPIGTDPASAGPWANFR